MDYRMPLYIQLQDSIIKKIDEKKYLPGGIGWYRKHFRVEDNATRHYIYFEGVKTCRN